jgi:hypothetical protein
LRNVSLSQRTCVAISKTFGISLDAVPFDKPIHEVEHAIFALAAAKAA